MAKARVRKGRDAEATRREILAAATAEFSRKGLGGARVDGIALRAKANKRMIYHYFGSKEKLFTAVLEEAYGAIRSAELELPLAELEPFLGGLGFFNVAANCSAVTVDDLVDCVFADSQCATERQIFRLDPRAQDSLTTAGVAASFPCVAP